MKNPHQKIKSLQDVMDYYETSVETCLNEFYDYINKYTTQEWINSHGDNIFNLLPKTKSVK